MSLENMDDGQSPSQQGAEILPRPETVISTRAGAVLLKSTILKMDHFPGCQNMNLRPLLEGAPNYRQVEGLPVYGVAVPTLSGFRELLEYIGASKGRRKVLWHNMREEPLLYINGRPYVVREADNPFANLEYPGIGSGRLEDMELRLKQDVLREAQRFDGQILLAHESDDFELVDVWEGITNADVQTSLEVYEELQGDGYDVNYLRVPVSDEKAPKYTDLDLLVQRLWDVPSSAALVFNCQMGRGRTTTGMVIASLLALRKAYRFPPLPPSAQPGLPKWFSSASKPPSPSSGSPGVKTLQVLGEDQLLAGNWAVIRALCRVLAGATACKQVLDTVLDACAAMQNLREAMAKYRARIFAESRESKRNALVNVTIEYLQRYYVLIAFAKYLSHPDMDPAHPNFRSFSIWMAHRPELESVLHRLLRRSPMVALQLYSTEGEEGEALARPLGPGSPEVPMFGPMEELGDAQGGSMEWETIIANRSGAVLGPATILKADHFPGMQSNKLLATFPGAPNFRRLEGLPIYGLGISTQQGLSQVLQHILAEVPKQPLLITEGSERVVAWHNMREEVMVYINGKPFVLRDAMRPYKNMQEYRGIDTKRLEDMEDRLKEDVLREAEAFGERLLVLSEGPLPSCTHEDMGSLVDSWESIQGPEDVLTPRQMMERLCDAMCGFRLQYCRVPVTDGTPLQPGDLDAIITSIVDTPVEQSAYVFNCQLGKGRTTVGMAAACLLYARRHGWTEEKLRDAGLSTANSSGDGSATARADPESSSALGVSPGASSDDLDEDSGSLLPLLRTATPVLSEDPQIVSMKAGGFLAVRRVVRVLDNGTAAKHMVDAAVDACGLLINLRTIIMHYRQPRTAFRYDRPEVEARQSAFKRGSVYLERYCQLIALDAYLQTHLPSAAGKKPECTFTEWIGRQAALNQVFESIKMTPSHALTALPVSPLSVVPNDTAAAADGTGAAGSKGTAVTLEEEAAVLQDRRTSTLTRHTILKSYHAPDVFGKRDTKLPGVSDLRCVEGLPVFPVANPSVAGLKQVLTQLGAHPGGHAHALVLDLREELLVYVAGKPYMRREREVPAAAFHHAGIHWRALQKMESNLRRDVQVESARCRGRILLHKELPSTTARTASSSMHAISDFVTSLNDVACSSAVPNPSHRVVPFWQPLQQDETELEEGVFTPLDVAIQLQSEGFGITYRRNPLSRERTPQPKDVDYLLLALDETLRAAAQQRPARPEVVYVLISRTAAGSSISFTSVLITQYLLHLLGEGFVGSGPLPAIAHLLSSQRLRLASQSTMVPTWTVGSSAPVWVPAASVYTASAAAGISDAASDTSDPAPSRSSVDAGPQAALERTPSMEGDYRDILNLCRVLPHGLECKQRVANAVVRCRMIGDIITDVRTCKHRQQELLEASKDSQSDATDRFTLAALAARRLGLHYLQRYFLAICFACYMLHSRPPLRSGAASQQLTHAAAAAAADAMHPFGEAEEAWVPQQARTGVLVSSLPDPGPAQDPMPFSVGLASPRSNAWPFSSWFLERKELQHMLASVTHEV